MAQAGLNSSLGGGLESRRRTVAEAHFSTWWGKAQDTTVARHGAWHQDGVSEWPGSWEGQGLPGFPIAVVLPASGASPASPPGGDSSPGGRAAALQGCFTTGAAGAVAGEPPHFAEKTGVHLKLVSLFELLHKKGWLLASSTSKLEIQGEETGEEASAGLAVAGPGVTANCPDSMFPGFSLLALFPGHS